ncbi:MAG TPA: D-aminoacyl-tRNA deacylase [Acidimicrobiales bacterium]|nr:D-aminoacyl-tRNA deacylase [Acidimicrobiales bacterium]
MRAVVQRVSSASVSVDGTEIASIGAGLCVLVGVGRSDDEATAQRLAERLWNLRVFEDDAGKMNRSASELGLALLVVSQFTLCADASRGRRPSFVDAAPPEQAEHLIERAVDHLQRLGAMVATGRFRAHMTVGLVNDGPVTIVLDL